MMVETMDATQIARLRQLAGPHRSHINHQREMDELVLMALTRIETLGRLSSDKGGTIATMIDDRVRLHARVSELQQQVHDSDAIYDVGALEGDRNALRDRVAELDRMLDTASKARDDMTEELGKRGARVAELEVEAKALAWANYQLCGLACDELGVSADAARATAASRRPDQRGEGEKDAR